MTSTLLAERYSGSRNDTRTIVPALVDEQLTADPVTLPALRRAIPRECFVVDDRRSWRALARVLTMAAGCLVALNIVQPDPSGNPAALIWQLPLQATLWLLPGWVLVGLFVIGHDCGHRSFSRSDRVNTIVGHLCLAPLGNNFHAWRLTHDHHHAYTQMRGEDVDWASFLMTRDEYHSSTNRPPLITRLGYSLPFGILLWVTWNALRRGVNIRTMIAPGRYARSRRELMLSNIVVAAALVAIYGGLLWSGGAWAMVKYHGIPAFIAMVTGWVLITIQHANEQSVLYEKAAWTPAKGQMASTFDIRFPRLLEFLWCRINLHIPHHVAPGIPWYNLVRAGAGIRRSHPELYQEHRFGTHHLSWFRRTPFLKRVEGAGYYTMDVDSSAGATI
jgi:omega-6 fatty acid desaturase (delta-12 desaturase)